MKRWAVGIFVMLAVVVVVDMAFLWVAMHNDDPVVPSYTTESR